MQKTNRIFGTFLIYFVCMALFCVMRILSETDVFNSIKSPELRSLVTTLIIQIGIMFLLPLILVCLFFKKSPKNVIQHNEYKAIGFRAILVSFLLGFLIYVLNVAVSTVSNGIIDSFGFKSYSTATEASSFSPIQLFFFELLLVAILPAICEEFLHRGVLLQGIRSMGYKKAIVISGVLFGLIHFSITQTIYATIIGVLLGFIVIATKSIVPAMIIHFTNNAISLYLSFASTYKWFGGGMFNWIIKFLTSSSLVLTFLACMSFLILLSTSIVFLIYFLYKLTTLTNVQREIDKKFRKSMEEGKTKNPIYFEGQQKIQEVVETSYTLNLYTMPIESPVDMMLPKQKDIYKPNFKDNIFLFGSTLLGLLVTIFTLIWGLV